MNKELKKLTIKEAIRMFASHTCTHIISGKIISEKKRPMCISLNTSTTKTRSNTEKPAQKNPIKPHLNNQASHKNHVSLASDSIPNTSKKIPNYCSSGACTPDLCCFKRLML